MRMQETARPLARRFHFSQSHIERERREVGRGVVGIDALGPQVAALPNITFRTFSAQANLLAPTCFR